MDRAQLNDTIAASATPPGTSGVALIRLSGPASKAVAAAIFRPQSPRFPAADAMPGYTCAPGWIVDPLSAAPEPLDQVVLTHFPLLTLSRVRMSTKLPATAERLSARPSWTCYLVLESSQLALANSPAALFSMANWIWPRLKPSWT